MSYFQLQEAGTPGAPNVEFLAGNTGGAVGPDAAFTINVLGSGNLTVTGNPGTNTLTISDNQSQVVTNYTLVTTANSPYTVTATDYYISIDSTAGPVTIRLPNAPTTYRLFVVKDKAGTSASNNISITTVGGVVTIDGLTTYLLNEPYEAADILFNGTSYEVF